MSASTPAGRNGVEGGRPRAQTVRDVMTPAGELATVSPEATLREVAEVLSSRHVSGAPVVSGSRVVGVISAADLLEFAASTGAPPEAADEGLEWSADPGDEWDEDGGPAAPLLLEIGMDLGDEVQGRFIDSLRADRNVFDEHVAAEVMSSRVITIAPEATLRQAAQAMRAAGVHRLVVMSQEALVGLISSTDVLHAVSDGRLAPAP